MTKLTPKQKDIISTMRKHKFILKLVKKPIYQYFFNERYLSYYIIADLILKDLVTIKYRKGNVVYYKLSNDGLKIKL